MISISVRVRDCNDRWRYTHFKSKEDKTIHSSDVLKLWNKVMEYVKNGEQPEIKYSIEYNRYVGCVSGMSGSWVRMIDEVRAKRIFEHTVDQINSAVANNQKQLGIGKVV